MAYVLIAAYLLVISPMQVGLLVHWEQGSLSATVGVMTWGMRKQFRFLLSRNGDGRLQLQGPFFRRRKKQRDYLSLLPRLVYVRKKIHSGIQVRLFQVQARIALPDAAAAALLCGVIAALVHALFPHGRSNICPSYRQPGQGRAVCIVDFRLGTLLLAGILWKTHRLSDSKKEERVWSIPSDN